jgi:hypothetical protein
LKSATCREGGGGMERLRCTNCTVLTAEKERALVGVCGRSGSSYRLVHVSAAQSGRCSNTDTWAGTKIAAQHRSRAGQLILPAQQAVATLQPCMGCARPPQSISP